MPEDKSVSAWMPPPSRINLLRAALSSKDAALDGWRSWCSGLTQFEDTDFECVKLYTLVSENIGNFLPEFEQGMVKGVQRRIWWENQRLFALIHPLLDALIAAEVPLMPLNGLAMILQTYQSTKFRFIGDVDIMLPVQEVMKAVGIIDNTKWSVPDLWDGGARSAAFMKSHYSFASTSGGLQDAKLRPKSIDFHWRRSSLIEAIEPAEKAFANTSKVLFDDRPLLVLNPTSQFLNICFHSARLFDTGEFAERHRRRLVWIADAVYLLRKHETDLDWQRIAAEAERSGLQRYLHSLLMFLRTEFNTAVPQNIIDKLAGASISPAEMMISISAPKIGLSPPDIRRSFYMDFYKTHGLEQLLRLNPADEVTMKTKWLLRRSSHKAMISTGATIKLLAMRALPPLVGSRHRQTLAKEQAKYFTVMGNGEKLSQYVFDVVRKWCPTASNLTLQPMSVHEAHSATYRVGFFKENKTHSAVVKLISPTESKSNFQNRYVAWTLSLQRKGIRVPSILFEQTDVALVLEDLGGTSLLEIIKTAGATKAEHLCKNAIDLICDLQQKIDPRLPNLSRRTKDAYVARMKAFTKHVVRPDSEMLADQLDQMYEQIASRLVSVPMKIMHTDFHAQNLLVVAADKLAIIDFQESELGSPFYDIAALLNDRDMDMLLGPDLCDTLLEYFRMNSSLPVRDFNEHYLCAVLQRDLTVAGHFTELTERHDLNGYAQWIPGTLRRIKSNVDKLAARGWLNKPDQCKYF